MTNREQLADSPKRYMEMWIRPDGVEFVRVSDLMDWLKRW